MKDLFVWLCRLLLVMLVFGVMMALSVFLNCLPAIILGHLLKG